jgi:hypothetical protein
MNPNPSPTPAPTEPAGPPAEGQAVVEFVRTRRQAAAYVFLALSLVFLVATIYLAVRAFRSPAVVDKPAATRLGEENPPEPSKVEVANPNRSSYMIGWLGCLTGFLVTGLVGVYLQVRSPQSSPDRQRTEARALLLAAGGLLGVTLIVFGAAYFYLWSDSLTKWLDKGERKEMVWVVVPLLMVAGGAGLVFAAVQPARADERNNLTLRRLVYGANFGVTVLLLLVVLVVVNVVIVLKVPNKLDTTESGFYTLSASTRNFLGKLTEPVNLYVIMPDAGGREVNDIRQFAYSAQEAAEGRLTVRFVSPVTNKQELQRLQEKYPRLGRDAYGLLLTAGEEGKRNAFVPLNDLFEMDPRTGNPKAFSGESKAMKELQFLTHNEQRPVVYFTQGHGELSLGGGPAETTVGGSASMLKSFLDKNYLDVRPLVFPPQTPTVPDDATILVVAEPQSTLPEAAVGAIRKFMTEPRKGGGKGKLIVLAGAVPGPDDKVVKTGLEGLLAEFDVRLGNQFVYSDPLTVPQAPDYRVAIVLFARAAEQNPIVQAVGKQIQAISFLLPREVDTTTAHPQYQATPLLLTLPGRETWVEDERIRNPEQTINDLLTNAAIRQRKRYTDTPRRVAAVVSEGGSGRVVVFGNAYPFTDEYASRRSRGGTPPTFDLMAVSIDWLRDLPPVPTGIESKQYTQYQFPEPAAVDATRLLYLPLGLAMLGVVGLGAGVWVIRRK